MPSLTIRMGKLRSEGPGTHPRSHRWEVLFLANPPALMFSTRGLPEAMGLGDPPPSLQGGSGLSQDMIPDTGPFGRVHGVGGRALIKK